MWNFIAGVGTGIVLTIIVLFAMGSWVEWDDYLGGIK